jgi:hypothetical protein
MKKLTLIFGILLFAVGIFAQDVKQSLPDRSSNVYYAGTAADTILNTDTWTYGLDMAGRKDVQLYTIHMKMDSVSGTPAHGIGLYGTFDGVTLDSIAGVSWAGTSSDTTFKFQDVSTGLLYRKMYIKVWGAATSKSKVNFIWGKMVNKTHE